MKGKKIFFVTLMAVVMSYVSVAAISLSSKLKVNALIQDDFVTTTKSENGSAVYGDIKVTGEESTKFSGITLKGTEGTIFDFCTLDLTKSTLDTPVISVIPCLSRALQEGNRENHFVNHAELYDLYIDMVAVNNPSKKLSFRIMPRIGDTSLETAITAAGDDMDYNGVSWVNGKLNPDLSGTQFLGLDGIATGRKIIDQKSNPIKNLHAIDFYYDYENNKVCLGSGVDKEATKIEHNGEIRHLIRDFNQVESEWKKFSKEEIKNVKLSVRYGTTVKRYAKVGVTAIQGKPLTADDKVDVIDNGVSVMLTNEQKEVAVKPSFIMSDNDVMTKLVEFSIQPEKVGTNTVYNYDANGYYVSFTDGKDTLKIYISERSDNHTPNFKVQYNDSIIRGADVGNRDKINAEFTTESPYYPDKALKNNNGLYDEDKKILGITNNEKLRLAPARYTFYYNRIDNSIYTNVGRLKQRLSFTENGKTVYRWKVMDLDAVFSGGWSMAPLFNGFEDGKTYMSIGVNKVVNPNGAMVKILNVDDNELNFKNTELIPGKASFEYQNEYFTAKNKPFILPNVNVNRFAYETIQINASSITDPDGAKVEIVENSFIPQKEGRYIVNYTFEKDNIEIVVNACNTLPVEDLLKSFETSGKNVSELKPFMYKNLPDYMNFGGAGINVVVSNMKVGQPVVGNSSEGINGLGIKLNKSFYINDNIYKSIEDYDSLIKLAFPSIKSEDKNIPQALKYVIVVQDSEHPDEMIRVVLAADIYSGDGVTVKAGFNNEPMGYEDASTERKLIIPSSWEGGIKLDQAYLDARSLNPIELAYDTRDNALYAICGKDSVLVRDFDYDYRKDGKIFNGFSSGNVNISVGVDMSNHKSGNNMELSSFTILGINGQDFNGIAGNEKEYLYDSNKVIVKTSNAVMGNNVVINAIENHKIGYAPIIFDGGTIEVLYNGKVVLTKEAYTGKNMFTAKNSGKYILVYEKGNEKYTGKIVVSPSVKIATDDGKTEIKVNDLILKNGQSSEALRNNEVLISIKKGYELSSIKINGIEFLDKVVDGSLVFDNILENENIIDIQVKAISYTITYKAMGGVLNGTDYTTEFTVDSTEIVLPSVIKDYYIFTAWFDGENEVKVENYVFTAGNKEFIAHFKEKPYTITYNCNYEGSKNIEDTFTIMSFETYILKEKIQRDGNWYLDGWFTEPVGGVKVESIKDCKDITVYAHWIAGYKINFVVDGKESSVSYKAGSLTVEPVAPIKEGYNFIGWFNGEDMFEFGLAINEDITLNAKFELKTFKVTFIVADKKIEKDIKYGEKLNSIEIPEIPEKEGYKQIKPHWNVELETIVKEDIEVVALYTIDTYKVTFVKDNGSEDEIFEVQYCDGIKSIKDPVKEGYEFVGWFDGEREYLFGSEVKSNITLKAKWVEIKITDDNSLEEKKSGCNGFIGGTLYILPAILMMGIHIIKRRKQ